MLHPDQKRELQEVGFCCGTKQNLEHSKILKTQVKAQGVENVAKCLILSAEVEIGMARLAYADLQTVASADKGETNIWKYVLK